MRGHLLRHAWAQTGLVAIIGALALHISSARPLGWDLTADQRYTLSAPARQAARALDRPLTATVWASRPLGAPYHNHEQAILDKLERLAAWSGGQLSIRVVDPTDDPDAQAEAASLGVHPVRYRFRSRARTEDREVWLGVSLQSGTRQLAVSPVAQLEPLEYQLVRGLQQLTRAPEDRPVVGWAVAAGTPELTGLADDHPLAPLVAELQTSTTVVDVTLGTSEPLPDDLDALLVVGPQRALSERAVWQLEQHLLQGRGLGLFLAEAGPHWPQARLVPVDHGLTDWLTAQGLTLEGRVLADRTRAQPLQMPVRTDRGAVMVEAAHPLLPAAGELSPAAPVVHGLDRLVLPFPAAVRAQESLTDRHPQVWAWTGPDAVSVPDTSPLALARWTQPLPDERPAPRTPLAVGVEGIFEATFAGRPPPAAPGASAPPEGAASIATGIPARLALVGSAWVVTESPLFTQNVVDWLVQDESLMAVRARSSALPQLELTERTPIWAWKLGIVGCPLALLWVLVAVARRRSL